MMMLVIAMHPIIMERYQVFVLKVHGSFFWVLKIEAELVK
jgi:hypothetical protein